MQSGILEAYNLDTADYIICLNINFVKNSGKYQTRCKKFTFFCSVIFICL